MAKRKVDVDLRGVLEGIQSQLERLSTTPPQPEKWVRESVMDVAETLDRSRADVLELASRMGQLEAVVERHGQRLEEFTHAIAEGIERVDRSERRVHAVVQRARKELAEDGHVSDRLEAEAADLSRGDADGSSEDGLSPVPARVAESSAGDPRLQVMADLLRGNHLPGSM